LSFCHMMCVFLFSCLMYVSLCLFILLRLLSRLTSFRIPFFLYFYVLPFHCFPPTIIVDVIYFVFFSSVVFFLIDVTPTLGCQRVRGSLKPLRSPTIVHSYGSCEQHFGISDNAVMALHILAL
jgi:hypothetical protein